MNAPNRIALSPAMIENRTFGELILGESASLVRLVTEDDVRLFSASSGDVNPAHLDP